MQEYNRENPFENIKKIFRKDYVEVEPQKKGAKIAISLILTLIITAVRYYISYPALNPHAKDFWYFLIGIAITYAIVFFIVSVFIGRNRDNIKYATKHTVKTSGIIVAVCILVLLAGAIISSTFFNAHKYAALLNVTEGNFTEDVDEISFDEIPMLDSDSAIKLGNAKLGELADMVSQFEVDETYYTQINYKKKPVRVTTLRYGDFFKWWKNNKTGLPAYMMVDMVTQEATAVRLESGIRYSESEYFNHKLSRYIQFHYPTKIVSSFNFEVDENGTPYWIVPCIDYTIGLFGGKDIKEIIMLNACTGESKLIALEDVPEWVDRAYSADLIMQQYDYHGTYANGFWNSIFGQKDVKKTTDGYNYIAQNDDVLMYTGVTSTGSDTANIGFLLSNQRTKETKFYSLSGAIESVAMDSAEGEAQNYKYSATFPLLLNVSGQPTYFMAMKDTSNLVKGYAMVNVKQYQVVSFANNTDPEVCKEKYISLLNNKNLAEPIEVETDSVTGTVTDIKSAVIDGTTYFYFELDSKGVYYKVSVSGNDIAVFIKKGDKVTMEKAVSDTDSSESIINADNIARGS